MLIAGDLRTRLSFGTSPEARAKSGMVGSFGYLFTLAAFKDLPFNLDGWDRRNINMPRCLRRDYSACKC